MEGEDGKIAPCGSACGHPSRHGSEGCLNPHKLGSRFVSGGQKEGPGAAAGPRTDDA